MNHYRLAQSQKQNICPQKSRPKCGLGHFSAKKRQTFQKLATKRVTLEVKNEGGVGEGGWDPSLAVKGDSPT